MSIPPLHSFSSKACLYGSAAVADLVFREMLKLLEGLRNRRSELKRHHLSEGVELMAQPVSCLTSLYESTSIAKSGSLSPAAADFLFVKQFLRRKI
jgi:hypothetical protein